MYVAAEAHHLNIFTRDLDSAVRARTGYQSLTCGEAPFSGVREQSVPEDCVGTFLPTPVSPGRQRTDVVPPYVA